jgi:hypothetical protein
METACIIYDDTYCDTVVISIIPKPIHDQIPLKFPDQSSLTFPLSFNEPTSDTGMFGARCCFPSRVPILNAHFGHRYVWRRIKKKKGMFGACWCLPLRVAGWKLEVWKPPFPTSKLGES